MTKKDFKLWVEGLDMYFYGEFEPMFVVNLHEVIDYISSDKEDHSIIDTFQYWVIVSWLCESDYVDYGTSPRFPWLTDKGEELRKYIQSLTSQELVDVLYED